MARDKFGWQYPAGAEHDPNAPWNQPGPQCQCGEFNPDNLETCRHPGCTNTGCDACSEIEWCCDEDDEDNGDYFCAKHRTEA